MQAPVDVLKKYWGYDQFRPLQEEIIQAVLSGKDCLALLPTGGGKSLCYQVPALMHDGLCLVITPLIALMNDQVNNLKKRGIPALSISSAMSFIEVSKTLKNAIYGNFKFLYVSPERLETELFLEYLPSMKLSLIAVDEAHCISQWGYDFRPSYLRIASLREYFPNVPILALTASATLEVQKDISAKLLFKTDATQFQQSFERANLSYSVFELSSKQNKLLIVLKNVKGPAIVYCKSRKRTKEVAELLQLNGISADFYHAGLGSDARTKKQEEWIQNKTRVICCTNAFGMGIDKPDVRVVVHYDVPDALENYYQEAGRAGRDGKKSYAVLFFNKGEVEELKRQTDVRFPTREEIVKVYVALCNSFQLAEGCGEGETYDFDINTFAKNFKLNAFLINQVLKIFEQQEWIQYSEQFFSPSSVVFTSNRKELEIFEKEFPDYDLVIKGLLRSYDGIFDYPSSINETALAKFIEIKKEKLIELLHQIHQRGVIEYVPQKEQPQIKFLLNRISGNDLRPNMPTILQRKKAFEKRLDAMIKFLQEKDECRSKMIGEYFNDSTIRECGICDNCLQQKVKNLPNEEFKKISAQIKLCIEKSPISLENLLQQLSIFPREKVRKVLQFLQEENELHTDKTGKIYL